MSWTQLSLEVDGGSAEIAGEALAAAGALSVTLRDAADEPLLEPAPGEQPLWMAVTLVALYPADFDLAPVVQALRTLLGRPGLRCRLEPLEDRDWSTTWREGWRPMHFGGRLWVCPFGESVPDPDAVVVHLDPGLAFGTGAHTTTALCLEWLARHPPAGLRVIDYGCGSGVLAIAAARLGAAGVAAVDIDPQALAATRDNAARNGIGGGLETSLPAALSPRPVDLLLANILANPLVELAGELSGRVRPGGELVMTGILAEQADRVLQAYRPGFDFARPVERNGWVLLAGRRR